MLHRHGVKLETRRKLQKTEDVGVVNILGYNIVLFSRSARRKGQTVILKETAKRINVKVGMLHYFKIS